MRRFWKLWRKHRAVVLPVLRPGVTIIVHNGVEWETLILTTITHDSRRGTTAEFVSLDPYLAERTMATEHTIWCTKGLHTVAEGCG